MACGIRDIERCFLKGDVGSCVSAGSNFIPSVKILKAGKSVISGINRAFKAYKAWQKAARLAEKAIARADSVIEWATKKADELAAALAKGPEVSLVPDCKKNSFVPGTLVLMADGSTKPIEEVRVGDEVIATDPETGESGPRVVTREITGSGDKALVEVSIDVDGDEGDVTDTIVATDAHPFWVANAGRWADAADLHPGDTLLSPEGSRVRVIDIVAYNAVATVHNLTVDDIHTYYVSVGNESVLVHNCGIGTQFGVPRKPGVYAIELNDGNFYIGSATSNMRGLVNAAGRQAKPGKRPHAVEAAGYNASDIVNVTWVEVPGNLRGNRYISKDDARSLEQSQSKVGWSLSGCVE
ncbi:polymorphic toxin-type HINT domain-containing protein [Micromonospora sp. NPDC003197]